MNNHQSVGINSSASYDTGLHRANLLLDTRRGGFLPLSFRHEKPNAGNPALWKLWETRKSFPRRCENVENRHYGFAHFHGAGSFHKALNANAPLSSFRPHILLFITKHGGIKKYSDISGAGLFSLLRLRR
jgi:hypothetical protein